MRQIYVHKTAAIRTPIIATEVICGRVKISISSARPIIRLHWTESGVYNNVCTADPGNEMPSVSSIIDEQ